MSEPYLIPGENGEPGFPAAREPQHFERELAARDFFDTIYPDSLKPESATLSEYGRILIAHKWTLLLAAALGLSAGIILSKFQSPLYRARALVEVQTLNQDFLNMRSVRPVAGEDNMQSPDSSVRTQTLIFQSRPILERALGKMDLEARLVRPNTPNTLVAWAMDWTHQLAGHAPPQPQGKPAPDTHQDKPEKPRTGSRSTRGGPAATQQIPAAQKPLADSRISAPQQKDGVPKDSMTPFELALRSVEGGLRVRPVPNTRLIELTFDSGDPQISADVANAVTASFIEIGLESRRRASQSTSKFLNQELADVKEALERAEDALQKYAKGSDLALISDKDNSAEERLRQLQAQLLKAHEDRVGKQSLYEMATSSSPESLPEVLDDATLKEYQVQITNLRRQLADLSSLFTAEHPKVVTVKAQIAAMETALEKKRAEIVSRIRNEYMAAERREKILNSDYAAQAGVVSQEASRVAHYLVLKREVDTNRQLYDSMLQRVREAGLASAMGLSDIRVVEPALPPARPRVPNSALNAGFGLLSGLLCGAALIIWRARSYRGIHEPGQIAAELQVAELGVIPATSTQRPRAIGLLAKGGPQRCLELTTWQEWPSETAESFRFALTSILLSRKDGAHPRLIAVSSANPGEGKTSVVCNLAIALARIHKRVVLIDGDLRRPRLHDIFQLDNRSGLSDLLAGNGAVTPQATSIPNLYVLPSGNSADEKLLFASQLSHVLRRLGKEFDMVLIDTPPLLKISDARLIGRLADAVILVVAQHTDRDDVRQARRQLLEDGSNLLGTILNNWDPKTSPRGYRGYGYSNRYYHVNN
jgi:succinoglycan biosynthesis transport protein ExoP